jgi:hypothetical protein
VKRAIAVVAVVLVVALGWNTAYRAGVGRDPAKRPRTDFLAYEAGADALASGQSPFGAKDSLGLAYVYPPAIALVVLPLQLLGRAAPVAWYALSVAVFAAGVAALRRALAPREGERSGSVALELGVPLALVALPLASGLLRGQIGPILAGLVALGAAEVARGREVRGGAWLGAAAALKATPVLAVLALAFDRRPRAFAGALAAAALLLGVGPALFLGPRGAVAANVDFVENMGLRYARDPGSAGFGEGARDYDVLERGESQSIPAMLWRAGLGRTRAFGPIVLALSTAVAAASLAPAIRRPRSPRALVAALGLAAAATLLVSPAAWHHHHVVLLPALVAVATDAARTGRRDVWVWLAVAGALEALHFAVELLRPLGLLAPATAIVLGLALRVALDRPSADAAVSLEPHP